MVDHLERNNLLCQNQHGFRKGKSCLTQLLHHLDDVINSFLSGNDVDAIYLDYAKAFDKVDHRLLLMKLGHYGFSDKMVEWIKIFLSNRYQKVVIDGRVSFLALILSGVPQGTCVLSSKIHCFADDTRVCKAMSSCQDVSDLQKDLENIIPWPDCNNMMLHEDKFEYICHQANRSNLLLQPPFTSTYFEYNTLGGITLHPANNIRDLGVYISDDLSWTHHIATICDKALQMAAWVFSVFSTRRTDIIIILYK